MSFLSQPYNIIIARILEFFKLFFNKPRQVTICISTLGDGCPFRPLGLKYVCVLCILRRVAYVATYSQCMTKHIRPPAECIGHNHWWEKRDSNSQSTRARHFKCRVYSVPPFSHIGWLPPPMDVFQFGPRSAKEPCFFLL